MFRCNRVNGCCIAWWSIFSFLICYYSSYVSPYYEIPVSCDPIIYHLMGRGMMEGLMPYRDLFDQKGPFIFFDIWLFLRLVWFLLACIRS